MKLIVCRMHSALFKMGLHMSTYTLICVVLTALLRVPYTSVVEWIIHRWMHSPRAFSGRLFAGHRLHHIAFRADKSYRRESPDDKRSVREGDQIHWHALIVLGFSAAGTTVMAGPFAALGYYETATTIAITATAVDALYLGAYALFHELLHGRFWQYLPVSYCKFVDEHHLRHHANVRVNLNLVLPIGDYLFRTRIER